VIFCDIDNTLCDTSGTDYAGATPRRDAIARLNEMYDSGDSIVLWTARGAGSGIDWFDLTKEQMDRWGVKYHQLRTDKPYYDVFFEDRSRQSL